MLHDDRHGQKKCIVQHKQIMLWIKKHFILNRLCLRKRHLAPPRGDKRITHRWTALKIMKQREYYLLCV